MRIETKGSILAVLNSICVLALAFSLALFLKASQAAEPNQNSHLDAKPIPAAERLSSEVEQGRSLFARNCAHCHGDDARGDEGPTLYNLAMSDARIVKRIKEGIKGEMPKFGSKLSEAEIAALIAYLRSLKE